MLLGCAMENSLFRDVIEDKFYNDISMLYQHLLKITQPIESTIPCPKPR